ncbi:hypothetical protein WG922_05180 [Ramlibacter sp. AN1015]|uniref:hypothetical protein n=1 Tax=Ramlibacter sp. AN1015 TaxID=3133428 RepID=UPI0030BE7CE2
MRSISLPRIAGVIGLSLGAAMMAGCANWGESSRMGAGASDSRTMPRGTAGPNTTMPSGTQGTSGPGATGAGGSVGTGAPGVGR